MKNPILTSGDVDFLIENEKSLLNSLIAFKAAILSQNSQELRMSYVGMYQAACGNEKREKAITQKMFNRIVGEHYSIKQISYVASAIQEIVMDGGYQKDRVATETKHKIILKQKHCCAICGRKFEEKALQIDHKIPQCIIGAHLGTANLQALCHDCNSQKVKGITIGMQPLFVRAMRNTR